MQSLSFPNNMSSQVISHTSVVCTCSIDSIIMCVSQLGARTNVATFKYSLEVKKCSVINYCVVVKHSNIQNRKLENVQMLEINIHSCPSCNVFYIIRIVR